MDILKSLEDHLLGSIIGQPARAAIKYAWRRITAKDWAEIFVDAFVKAASSHCPQGGVFYERVYVDQVKLRALITERENEISVLSFQSGPPIPFIAREIKKYDIVCLGNASISDTDLLSILERCLVEATVIVRHFLLSNEQQFREIVLQCLSSSLEKTDELTRALFDRMQVGDTVVREIKNDTSKMVSMLQQLIDQGTSKKDTISVITQALTELRQQNDRFRFDLHTSIGLPQLDDDRIIATQSICIDRNLDEYLTLAISTTNTEASAQESLPSVTVGLAIPTTDDGATLSRMLQNTFDFGTPSEIGSDYIHSIDSNLPDIFKIFNAPHSCNLRLECNVSGFDAKFVKLVGYSSDGLEVCELPFMKLSIERYGRLEILFSNVEEKKPFGISLSVPLGENQANPEFSLNYTPEGFAPSHLVVPSKFLMELPKASRLAIIHIETGDLLFSGEISSLDVTDVAFFAGVVYRLSRIAQAVGVDFRMPKVREITRDDYFAICSTYEHAIQTGLEAIRVTEFRAVMNCAAVKDLVSRKFPADFIMRFGGLRYSLVVFGNSLSIDLGPIFIVFRESALDMASLRKQYNIAVRHKKDEASFAFRTKKKSKSEAYRVFEKFYNGSIDWIASVS